MVLKWIITHLFLCNYSQFDKHRKPKSTFFYGVEPSTLPHPPRSHWTWWISSKNASVSRLFYLCCGAAALLKLHQIVGRKMQQSTSALAGRRPLRCRVLAYYSEVVSGQCEESYTYGCPGPAQSISVSEGKVMGLLGGSLGQSKQRRSQHSKQTLPHVWTTHLEPYSSSTHSRAPLSVLFLLTPPFFFFLA